MVEKAKIALQPGDKIYHLFGYKEVLIRGSKESFIIRIEKVEESKKSSSQYARAMG